MKQFYYHSFLDEKHDNKVSIIVSCDGTKRQVISLTFDKANNNIHAVPLPKSMRKDNRLPSGYNVKVDKVTANTTTSSNELIDCYKEASMLIPSDSVVIGLSGEVIRPDNKSNKADAIYTPYTCELFSMKQQKVIVDASCIAVIGILKNKIANTSGIDFMVWNNALFEARKYWHELKCDFTLEAQFIAEAKRIFETFEYCENFGLSYELYLPLEELKHFSFKYGVKDYDTLADYRQFTSDIQKGIPYREVIKKELRTFADGKHFVYVSKNEKTDASKAIEKLKVIKRSEVANIGADLIHIASEAFTGLGRTFVEMSSKYNVPFTVENLLQYCKESYESVNAYIYKQKKHEQKSWTYTTHDAEGKPVKKMYTLADTLDIKLGTKENRGITDTVYNEVEKNCTLESLAYSIRKDARLGKTEKFMYIVFIEAMIDGLYDDTETLEKVSGKNSNTIYEYRKRFLKRYKNELQLCYK